VRTLVDARLREEAERFSFRFACDDCVHFDEGAPVGASGAANVTVGATGAANVTVGATGAAHVTNGRCSLRYPAEPRRTALAQEHVELCKEFELGT
jgi:hypothetical protein